MNLPSSFRCHPVFHISDLEPHIERTSDSQSNFSDISDLTDDSESAMIVQDSTAHGVNYYCVCYVNRTKDKYIWLKKNQIDDPQLVQQYLVAKRNKSNRSHSGAPL